MEAAKHRLAAFLGDLVPAVILALVLALPFTGDPDRVRLGFPFFNGGFCEFSGPAVPALRAQVRTDAEVFATPCHETKLGQDNGWTAHLFWQGAEQAVILVDASGHPVTPWLLDIALLPGTLLLTTALPLALWGTTLGLHRARLQIEPRLSLSKAIMREMILFWPILATCLASVMDSRFGLQPSLPVLAATGTVFALTHLWPFARGEMAWDKLVGTAVVRKRDLPF